MCKLYKIQTLVSFPVLPCEANPFHSTWFPKMTLDLLLLQLRVSPFSVAELDLLSSIIVSTMDFICPCFPGCRSGNQEPDLWLVCDRSVEVEGKE